jgi:uncharacterized repeat protein (TIGR03803 family)
MAVGELVLGPKAILYGTTIYGGSSNSGTVFELTKEGVETPLYSGTGGADGANPNSKLVRDALGNLYGTTVIGGPGNFGTVFTISRTGNEQVLYTFTGGNDGAYPNGIVRDSKGNLYGSSQEGGVYDEGVVFKLEPTGVETVLHSFTGGTDGGRAKLWCCCMQENSTETQRMAEGPFPVLWDAGWCLN